MDMSTGTLVEEGMAVGIIAAQSIGCPVLSSRCVRSTSRVACRSRSKKALSSARRAVVVRLTRIRAVKNAEGFDVVLNRNGEITLIDDRGREIESYEVPAVSRLMVKEGEKVKDGQTLCDWNPYSRFRFCRKSLVRSASKTSSKAKRCETEREPSGNMRMLIIDHKGELHPQIVIENEEGKTIDAQYLPERASIKSKKATRSSPYGDR